VSCPVLIYILQALLPFNAVISLIIIAINAVLLKQRCTEALHNKYTNRTAGRHAGDRHICGIGNYIDCGVYTYRLQTL
jgi:hypothetical protein